MTAGARPTFVLVPGAGGSAFYWHRVVAELARRGVAGVAVELPAGDDHAGLPEYAAAVVDAIDAIDTPIVVVAQSLGGFTAPLVCSQRTVSRLVLVNAMIPQPGETPGDWWGATGQAEARQSFAADQGRAVPDDPFSDFFHDVPSHVVAEVMAQPEPRQADLPFGQPLRIERWPDVPTSVIVGADDRFFPAEFQIRVSQDRLGITPHVIPGGHLVALSHPGELVDRLLRDLP
ncbi:MAG: alpha/beta hydrolase [Ilumatobacteraceae bacterium]